ncbi:MAG: hypothetical protein ACTSP9_16665, partial [Promethearchaeota archaeon]
MIGNKKRNTILLIIIFFFLGFNLFSNPVSAIEIDVDGLFYQGQINPNEEFSFNFLHNLKSTIRSDVGLNLSINYQNILFNRQISIIINNSNPISLNITTKFNILQFLPNRPNNPILNDSILIFNYNCVYEFLSNVSIDRITFQFNESSLYGLSLEKDYKIVVYKANEQSWELLSTEEKIDNSTSELYLETSITNLDSDTSYFFTICEISEILAPPSYDWIWFIIIPVFVVLIAFIIVISKEDYINYVKN